MESPYIDLFEPNENDKNRLLKSMSSSNFGSTYAYNLINRKINNIKSAKTPNKYYHNFNLKSSSKNGIGLSQEFIYFSNVKNKKVRNIYETILKNSCREKEPRMIHLKNLFRAKKKKSFYIKNDDKNNLENINFIANGNIKKKSRTSNNLPFIIKSSSLKILKLNNSNTNYINNSEIMHDNENKINHSNKKKTSLFFKNSLGTNKNPNKRYNSLKRPHSIKENKNVVVRNSKIRDYLNFFDKDFDKGYNSIDLYINDK